MKTLVSFIFFIFSFQAYAAPLRPGDSVVYPVVTSIEMVEGSNNQSIRVKWTLMYGNLIGVYNDGQAFNNFGAMSNIIYRDRKSGYAKSIVSIPNNISCNSSDGFNFQSCLKRHAGQTYQVISNYDADTCLDIGLQPINTGILGWGIIGGWLVGGYFCGQSGTVTPPPPSTSVCSLNSQNLNLDYSSTSLSVNGIKQSTNITVSCTSGDAKDYELKLTSGNAINGRLNFGNGVSAQIALNGINVQANGASISLKSLKNSTISIDGTLTGTASAPGITNSNGVLVLNAL